MYLSISFGKPTPPQDRQLDILFGNSEQLVDNLMEKLTFSKSIDTFCEIRMARVDGWKTSGECEG
jgi:hypothetical protein